MSCVLCPSESQVQQCTWLVPCPSSWSVVTAQLWPCQDGGDCCKPWADHRHRLECRLWWGLAGTDRGMNQPWIWWIPKVPPPSEGHGRQSGQVGGSMMLWWMPSLGMSLCAVSHGFRLHKWQGMVSLTWGPSHPPCLDWWATWLHQCQGDQNFYRDIFCILFDIKDLIFLCVWGSEGCMHVCVCRALVLIRMGCD